MKRALLNLHRVISLVLAGFWLIQVATGVLLVFHWELDGFAAGTDSVAFSPGAISDRVAEIEAGAHGRKVTSIWTSGAVNEQFDIYVREPGASSADKWRINGAGEVLRTGLSPGGAFFDLLVRVHTEFLAGPGGRVLVGVSGVFLVSNVLIGAVLAWPRARHWRALLRWPSACPAIARNYGWHRLLGLGVFFPTLVVVTFGVLLAFEKPLGDAIAEPVTDPAPAFSVSTDRDGEIKISPELAIEAALSVYPDASLTALRMPSDARKAYEVRLRQPGEANRIYGDTVLIVSATSGEVALVTDPFRQPPGRAFMSFLFPVHTGQAIGLVGRVIALAAGCGVLVLMIFGVMLFTSRLRSRTRRSQ
ncbi:PepSY-associated TM helix domain-containing protein [Hyphomonas sp. NPDC076900]|uniref:PepSY-associated TM helix domain-containing protein n=1 Tax=unclassified Hyphomonas TaxID=2630699 RepID=UPI003D086F15